MIDKIKIIELYNDGWSPKQISQQLNVNHNTVNTVIHRDKIKQQNLNTSKIAYKGDVKVFEYTGVLDTNNPITVDYMMTQYGLNAKDWNVVSFTTNTWQSQGKDNQVIDLCQSKLTVKPVKQNDITFNDIDEFLNGKTFKNLDIKNPTSQNNTGDVLEIDIADLHCGLLSWRNETGNDYDLKICANQFLEQIWDIVTRCKTKRFTDIYICTLGDIIHVDNDNNTTTKGTIQQVDGRIAKIFDYAFDIMNTVIDWFRPLGAKIHYVYLCGNHDRNTGYYLAKCLQMANGDVDFDITPKPQKAIHFGVNLIGLSHGDLPKKNKGLWLINDYREQFGKSKIVEEHCGHIHCEEARAYNGILVRSVLAPTGASYWENQQGYRSKRGVQSFVWDKQKGLREIWYNFID